MHFDTRSTRMLALLLFLVPAGCATQHLQTERALAAAGFMQHRGTPDAENILKKAQPYVVIPYKDKKLGERFFFVSPARKTVFEGDKAAMRRLELVQQQQARYAAAKAEQNRIRWAQFGQALAMGAAQAGQNMQQQAAYQPQIYQPPPTVNVASAFRTQTPGIVAQDGTYLGKLSSNPYDPDSVSNPYGRYGSKYSPTSINNPYSTYGSPYSPRSANNPYATQAPALIGY